ncbi:MAG: DUF5615 family PIN-like protein [Phormidesmis sp. CAN_BIN36]|nr:DUF5615 family PIN-like protein [Phormidesmis sp. CAN_BIN36]
MKLLYDQNLSPLLVDHLAGLYPESKHVYEIGLDRSDDLILWTHAQQYDFIIVTRDADFNEISLIRGFPPKVVWIRRGNCSTREIEAMLRSRFDTIQSLNENSNAGILTLF